MNRRYVTSISVLLLIWLTSTGCSQTGDRTAGSAPELTPDSTSHILPSRRVNFEEARSLLTFKPALPSFLPEGLSPDPLLVIGANDQGAFDTLDADYVENQTAEPSVRRLRMRVRETANVEEVYLNDPREILSVAGAAVQLEVGTDPDAQIVAGWSSGGVGFFVWFYWLPDGRTPQQEVTEEMRGDALRVIESLISQQ